MAYVAYEDLTPSKVNYRIIPRLRKYYRADGTFDLFDVNHLQVNCLRYLASVGEAGVFSGYSGSANFGNYSITGASTYATFMNFSTGYMRSVRYNSISNFGLKLKLNNRAGAYPYLIKTYGSSGRGASGSLKVYPISGSAIVVSSGAYITWSAPVSSASSMWDYKDYDYLEISVSAADTSKYGAATTGITDFQFIHKFSAEHPLYRYYT